MADNKKGKYIPMSLEEFVQGLKTPVDLYVKLSEKKFVLLVKKGNIPENGQLTTYKDKKINYLWVKANEYTKLSKQNIIIAGIAVSKNSLKLEHKVQFISSATSTVFKELDHMGITQEVYENAKQVTDATLTLVETNNNLSSLFGALNSYSNDIITHSIAVSALSVLIAQSMGWQNKSTMEKLSLGGLLHDIGLKTLSPELLEKSIAEYTHEELKTYESHPYKGMELAISLGVVPDDVVSIIYEHEENSIGQGYPRRIRDLKMHPLAKVVALANALTKLVIKSVNCPNPKTPIDAVMYIENTMGQPYNKIAFNALKSLIVNQSIDKAA